MTLTHWKSMTILAAVALICSPLMVRAGDASYIGTKKCKMCHKSEAKGRQFGIWEASAHARAFEALGTEKAKEVAAKAGVEGNPQESPECLECHTTAAGVDAARLGKGFVREQGVQCEACHGPGSAYFKKKIMQDRDLAVQNGLVIPDESTCKGCHNEKSPTFKGFDYETYWKKIEHPKPAG